MVEINREKFFSMLAHRPTEEMETIQDAYWLAKDGHRVQKRDDGQRYFEHPRRVAMILMGFGRQETSIIVTSLLHDLIEDTFVPPRIIVGRFGTTIWHNISTLSHRIPLFDPVDGGVIGYEKKDRSEYYASICGSDEAVRLVKCADRYDNLDIKHWAEPRQRHYLAETRKYVLPIAAATHPDLARKIKGRVCAFENNLDA